MITFRCPDCGMEINAPDRLAGEEDTCPYCKKTIRISPIAVDPNAPAADQGGGPGRPGGAARAAGKGGPFVQVLMIAAVVVMVLGACYVWLFQGDVQSRRQGKRPGLTTTQLATPSAATRPASQSAPVP